MRFEWPEMLWLMVAVAGLAATFAFSLRRRQRQATQLGHLLVAAGPAAARPLRTHVEQAAPPVLMLLAMVAAVLAAARPTAVVTLPSRQQTIMMAMDVSLSMRARDVEPNRLVAAQTAAKDFVRELPPELRVGIVAFAGTATLVQPPTRNRDDVVAAIDRFEMQRATATGSAIMVSLATIFPDQGIDVESAVFGGGGGRDWAQRDGKARDGNANRPGAREGKSAGKPFEPVPPGSYKSAVIILLSDGRRTTGPDPIETARMAADRGVRIYTVGFGTQKGGEVDIGGYSMYMRLDEEALKTIADVTRGEYFYAGTAADLRKVYADLSSRLVLEKAETEVTALLAALAAALAVASAALSVKWYGRIA